VPWNPILVKPVTTAVGMKGSRMKRMTNLKTVLPGTRTAMWASGKTNAKELPEEVRWSFPLHIWRKYMNSYTKSVAAIEYPDWRPTVFFTKYRFISMKVTQRVDIGTIHSFLLPGQEDTSSRWKAGGSWSWPCPNQQQDWKCQSEHVIVTGKGH